MISRCRNQRDQPRLTKRRDRNPNGSGRMDLLEMELAKARQSVSRAKLDLERAEELLGDDCGVGISLALCGRIRSAQRRVSEAKRQMVKIDPPARKASARLGAGSRARTGKAG
ncbi:hypothetical protein X740_15735 [Mesorhizobium sp. LNHC221B00]|nr:hypothetical protein X740_15735 [Mesorhizobium sp. LNHC221B00]